ncbi:GCN5-related N-acetyltransferase 5, chloroplastic, variant 2 [Sarracenia purpurea var. burkii]
MLSQTPIHSSMAGTISPSLSLEPHHHRRHRYLYSTTPFRPHETPFLTRINSQPLVFFPKFRRYNFGISFSTSSSSTSSSTRQDPFRTGRFLTNEELEKLQFLDNFSYSKELKSGSMWVRVMKLEEMDMVVALLSESFGESMMLPAGYVTVLGFLVKQYLTERRTLMPHTATLIGFYAEHESEDLQLAGTVEVCFDGRGANASPPTPTPPKDSPYICNMTVKKPLRRRGIGWHLLKVIEFIKQIAF